MIDVRELKAEMVRSNITQKELARKIGISEKTLISRLNKGVFGTDEAEIIVRELNITDPCRIFFPKLVTSQVTESIRRTHEKYNR